MIPKINPSKYDLHSDRGQKVLVHAAAQVDKILIDLFRIRYGAIRQGQPLCVGGG